MEIAHKIALAIKDAELDKLTTKLGNLKQQLRVLGAGVTVDGNSDTVRSPISAYIH